MSGIIFWVSVALVGYVYAGYPLIVSLAAHLRRRPIWPAMPLPKVTLVVAAYNEALEIGPKLESVLALQYPHELLQIIVAADGSTDSTPDIVRTFANRGVELVHQPERAGKMAAINRAATWATGDVIIFSDANNRLHTDALIHLVAPFASDRVGVTVGYKTVTTRNGLGASEGAYWRYEAHIRRMETRLGCTVGVNGEIFAIRRELLHPAPAGTINDDQWMAHMAIQQGFNVIFCPQARSQEPVSASASDEAERRSRMVAGQYQIFSRAHQEIPWRRPIVAWMLVSHKLLRPLVPFGMIGAALGAVSALILAPDGGGLLQLGSPWAMTATAGQVAFYGAALAGRRLEKLGLLGYLPRFLVDSNVSALRGLWRHLSGNQTALWERVGRSTS